MDLASLVRPALIFPELPGPDRESVLHGIAERFAKAGFTDDGDRLYAKLLEREELGSTCVVPGVAIPHCKLDGLPGVLVSIGICSNGAAFGAPEEDPVTLFFTVISPSKDPAAHLQSLALISRWIKTNSHVEKLLELSDPEEILDFLHKSEGDAE